MCHHRSQVQISTHILTRRMTTVLREVRTERDDFNSHPHKEDDEKTSKGAGIQEYFNSHPHKEDDREMTQQFLFLTLFQLTSSQGG